MTQDIEKYVDEYGRKFYPTLGYNRYQEGADWLRTTLTKVAEEAYKAGYIKGGLDEQMTSTHKSKQN